MVYHAGMAPIPGHRVVYRGGHRKSCRKPVGPCLQRDSLPEVIGCTHGFLGGDQWAVKLAEVSSLNGSIPCLHLKPPSRTPIPLPAGRTAATSCSRPCVWIRASGYGVAVLAIISTQPRSPVPLTPPRLLLTLFLLLWLPPPAVGYHGNWACGNAGGGGDGARRGAGSRAAGQEPRRPAR